MTKFTLALLTVEVIHNESDTEVHPANFGPNGDDLLDVWGRYMRTVIRAGGERDWRRYFFPSRLGNVVGRQRQVEFDYGYWGQQRTVRDVATGGMAGSVKPRETATDTLRSVLDVPSNGMLAYLAIELAGTASVVGMLSWNFRKWFHKECPGYRAHLAFVDDPSLWDEFLDGAQLRELRFRRYVENGGDRSARPRVEEYTLKPIRGEFLPRGLLDTALMRRLRPSDVLTVDVPDDIDETRAIVTKDGQRRTIQIGGSFPNFTWEIQPDSERRPEDTVFFAEAQRLLAERHEALKLDPTE